MKVSAKEKIIVALDAADAGSANRMLDALGDSVCWIKIGLQLFIAEGPGFVRSVKARGLRVFLDLKIHDIPNTAIEAVKSARSLGVDMTTVHVAGGPKMVSAAIDAAGDDLLVLGVTVLTSMDDTELAAVGISGHVGLQVGRLVAMGREHGLRGVVCSPLEIAMLREAHGRALTIVTPGVRPTGSAKGDQSRVLTPAEAVRAGANQLVIGRPITAAASPRAAVERIIEEINPGNS